MTGSVADTDRADLPVVEVASAITFEESKAYTYALTRMKRLGISEEDAKTLLGEEDV